MEMRAISRWIPRRVSILVVGTILAVIGLALLPLGCSGPRTDSEGPTKVKVVYLGLTCEPPIFVAYEKGFFAEEGLDVELVKSDWDSMRDGLGLGKFDATHHLLMYMMAPIENKLDVKIAGGIHTGCLRLQAGVKTDIKTVEDLKGKTIGVPVLGSPPHLFASRVLAAHGMHPETDVTWLTLPASESALALDNEQIQAVASAEPIGTKLIVDEKVRTVCDQAVTPPYDDEYCCVVTLNGTFARERPEAAAKVTRALLKGAKWVSANPTAAAKLAVEKKYVSATAAINAQAISVLKYEPGVSKCRKDMLAVAREMKKGGFLKPATDPEELVNQTWVDLDGVTDEWVKSLEVEKVAGGGRPPKLSRADFAALFEGANCCDGGVCLGCCGELGRGIPPLTGEWALVRPERLVPEVRADGGKTLVRSHR
jgi:NitT/TauT family transport system substrate-binding protein